MKKTFASLTALILIFSIVLPVFAIIPQPMYDRTEIAEKPISEHPRLMFKKEDIAVIKENLSHPSNAEAYKEFSNFARLYKSGKLPESDNYNYDEKTVQVLEANAFDYIINGNVENGKNAVDGIINFMNTVNYDPKNGKGSNYHDLSHILMIAAEIYDWCYPVMDDDKKTAFIEAGQRVMSILDWGYPVNLKDNSMVTGGGSSTMLLIDLFSFALATYDETPDFYNYISSVIKERNMPARNYWYESGKYMSGSSYGAMRAYSDSWLYWMVSNALDAKFHEESFENIGNYVIYEHMPDGKYLREGDENWHAFTQTANDYDDTSRFTILNILASMTGNEYYKEMAEIMKPYFISFRNSSKTTDFQYGYVPFTAVQYLFINNPEIGRKELSSLPKTKYFGDLDATMIAKTGWERGIDSSDAVAYMKIGGNQLYDHLHNDMGTFQIYYKGFLMQDLGTYRRTDNPQYYAHNISTVSHNGLLIYDPLEYIRVKEKFVILKDEETDEYYDINTGGQKYMKPLKGHYDLSKYNKDLHDRADVTAYGFGPDENNPSYSYISGDITKAYSEKAKDADRSMMFMPTGIQGAPAVFMIMDKITSENKYMDKKFLFQCVCEPEISGNAITVRRGTHDSRDIYEGEITSQVLLPENFRMEPVGGEGKQWYVNGHNFIPDGYDDYGTGNTRLDFGWGRVEISSEEENETEYFLNVMYVNDQGKFDSVQTAELIKTEELVGGKVLNTVTLFNKNEERIKKNISFELRGNDKMKVSVTGMDKGNWNVYRNGELKESVSVSEKSGVLYFEGEGGRYQLRKASLPTPSSEVCFDNGKWILKTDKSPYEDGVSFKIGISGKEIITSEEEYVLESVYKNSEFKITVTAFFEENSVESDSHIINLNTYYGGGEGTRTNPYKISAKEHFLNISKNKNAYYILTDNIVITDNYVPFEFTGILDGNNKGIMLNLNHPAAKNIGLFSALSEDSEISDLKIYGKINGNSHVGGIAGSSSAVVKNCVNYAEISSANGYAGGIAGYSDSNMNTVRNCVNMGKIMSANGNYSGGITGYNKSPLILCGNYGEVSSKNYAGGITGGCSDDVYGCYNHGTVTADNTAGGIIGVTEGSLSKEDSHIYRDSYNAGKIYGEISSGIIGCKNADGGKILRCYNTGEAKKAILGKVSENLVPLHQKKDCYALSSDEEDVIVLSEEEFKNAESFGFDFSKIWEFKDNSYPYPQLKFAEEIKTEESFPVAIYDESDFINIKNNPTGSYVLMNDIELSASYEPFAFGGKFNGENNKITVNISTDTPYTGLFSYLYKAPVIENLIIAGSITTSGSDKDSRAKAGALAGAAGHPENKLTGNAIIRNVSNYSNITSTVSGCVGGIIGDCYYGVNSKNVIFEQTFNHGIVTAKGSNVGGLAGISAMTADFIFCANYGNITAKSVTGGISGLCYGDIICCYNTADITGTDKAAIAGGISGSVGSSLAVISDCCNLGEIGGSEGDTVNTAGIVGKDLSGRKIVNCYNAGGIDSDEKAIIAVLKTAEEASANKTIIENCYYLSENESSSVAGTFPLSEEKMKIKESFKGFDFENVWGLDGNFPYIKNIIGNLENPELIRTAEDFLNMDSEGTYRLANDIDLSSGYIPFEFSGKLYGNGYSIRLNHNYPNENYIGLFSKIKESASVSDVVIEGTVMGGGYVGGIAGEVNGSIIGCVNRADISVNPEKNEGSGSHGGGIAGHTLEKAIIQECENYGSIKGRGSYFGGIAGVVFKSSLDLCANFGVVSTYSGGGSYGGIAGNSTIGKISRCINFGNISASGAAGGIIGGNAGKASITNCYNAGNITSGGNFLGGIFGYSLSGADIVTNCYNAGVIKKGSADYSSEKAIFNGSLPENATSTIENCYFFNRDGNKQAPFGIPLSEAEMKNKNSYTNFDFDNVWIMKNEGYYYPQLRKAELKEDFCYNPFGISAPVLYPQYQGDLSLLNIKGLDAEAVKALHNKYVILNYSDISLGNEEFRLKECGIVISSGEKSPLINKNGCIIEASDSLNEKFGIISYGNLLINHNYYVRPYGIYEYMGSLYTMYGETKTASVLWTIY